MNRYHPMPDTDGGADYNLVTLDQHGKPSCRSHGAMNKVSPGPEGWWRCLHLSGCRAGCAESTIAKEAGQLADSANQARECT